MREPSFYFYSYCWQVLRLPKLRVYGFKTSLEAFNYHSNPIDNLAALRQYSIPVLFVTEPGIAHKHGLADAAPITDFIMKQTKYD